MKERLQKIIAAAGIASRRRAEKLIAEGRVSVNGMVVTELGTKADSRQDVIRIDGNTINSDKILTYIALHKPVGFVTTMHDPQSRPTIVDLISDITERVYPVGRLDYDTEGLILLTNDGDFAQKVQHPRFQLSKVYRVKVQGRLSKEEIKKLANGVKLGDDVFRPENVQIEKFNDKSCWLRLILKTGQNRIIRRGFEVAGHRVVRLVREAIGAVSLGNLQEGSWRNLTHKEISQLLNNTVSREK